MTNRPNPPPVRPKGARILVVDDERPIRRFLRAALASHGYTVIESAAGQEALQLAATEKPEVIILDLGLPDIDGLEVTRQLREWTQTPVIILSVSERELDKVAALDAGADDYLTKPFGVAELIARIRVALRHSYKTESQPVFQVEGLRVDLAHRLVSVDEQEISLTPNEYDLLKLLVKHAGKVITHRQLLHEVWGVDYETEGHLLRVNISNLRHKIEPDPTQPKYILTESGVGYRLKTTE
ncbi:MAG: response regulator [Anaerolineaceae bacterium]|nr:response regulator [Anaerolineaceae bacterium]